MLRTSPSIHEFEATQEALSANTLINPPPPPLEGITTSSLFSFTHKDANSYSILRKVWDYLPGKSIGNAQFQRDKFTKQIQ